MTRAQRACLPTLLLGLLLLALPVSAGSQREPRPSTQERSLSASLVRAVGLLFPFLAKSSGTMDPDGAPRPASAQEPDASGTMDPDGRQ